MSLLPLIFRDVMAMSRPLRMLENHMRLTDELLQPVVASLVRRPRFVFESEAENVVHDKDKFQVKIDVQSFAPQEITVKAVDGNAVQIEAKHEEKQDGTGFVSRHFVRKFVLPHGHELKDVVSSLSSDGILTVTAPTKFGPSQEERIIQVDQTGPERDQTKSEQQIEEKKAQDSNN